MATIPRIYTLQMLHQIGQLAKTEYHHFHLPVVLRLAIIAIGFRKTKLGRPYHQSKADHKIFHRIHRITSQCKAYKQTSSKLNTDNLIKITNQNDRSLHQNIAISYINARSIFPKFHLSKNTLCPDTQICV